MKTVKEKRNNLGQGLAGFTAYRVPLALTGLPVGGIISFILLQAKPEVLLGYDTKSLLGLVGLFSDVIQYLTSMI